MHILVKKSGKEAPALKNIPNMLQSPVSSSNFNINKMTNLIDQNVDNRLLKDCKISPKIYRPVCKTEPKNGSINFKDELFDIDEATARKELGDDIVNTIDDYLSKSIN